MLYVYLLVLVLYTSGLNAANTTLTAEMCYTGPPGCDDCVKEWTLCPGKDGVLLCTLKQYLVDPESGTCEFQGCPLGQVEVTVSGKRSCVPLNRIVNGSLTSKWQWDGCSKQFYINCGNYLPVCVNADTLTSYNVSAGGCVTEGCPPTTHPCKVENGTECLYYDDLKEVILKRGVDECIRATAEEKAAARATVPPAAQEKTEPKASSSSSSWHLVISAFTVLATKLNANVCVVF